MCARFSGTVDGVVSCCGNACCSTEVKTAPASAILRPTLLAFGTVAACWNASAAARVGRENAGLATAEEATESTSGRSATRFGCWISTVGEGSPTTRLTGSAWRTASTFAAKVRPSSSTWLA